jgi:iron complex outermembrane receptor protein
LALASAIAATSTVNAAPAARAALAIEEVVVTARKREEAIQDVPVAITAVTSETLERSLAANFEEATRLTPGFTVPQSNSSPLALALSMRGSVQTSVLVTMDPSVGVYVDDVYIARTFGIGVDLLDLQDIQVLKGPQGTLFGRNSTAGAMLLNSKNPELGMFNGSIGVTGGPDNKRLTGIVNVPLLDTLALRVALQDSERDDYVDNRAIGTAQPMKNWDTRIGGRETDTYRAKLRWVPTESLDMMLSWDKFSVEDRQAAVQLWRSGFDQPAKPDVTFQNFDPHNSADTETVSFIATYSADDWELKFVASDRDWQDMREMDYDGGDLAGIGRHGTWGREAGDQQTYELQLNTSLFDERVDLVAGVLHFREFAQYYDYSYGFDISAVPPPGPVGGNYVENNVKSMGYYSQATWHINDVSNLTLGVRYTSDKKYGDIYGDSNSTATLRLPSWDFSAHKASLFNRTTGSPAAITSPSETFTATNWLASYDYRLTDEIMVYAKASTGFRAGGFNGRGARLDAGGNPIVSLIYDPEELLEYEIGFKGDFLDRRLRWNMAIYTNETTDKQLNVILNSTDGGPPGTSVANAGEAEAKGFETEFTFLIDENWSIGGSYSYIDAEITKQDQGGVPVASDYRTVLMFIPENQWTLAANYDREFSTFRLAGTASYSWIDEMFGNDKSAATAQIDSGNLSYEQAKGYVDASTTDAYGLLNINLTASPLDDRYSISLWCKNALDERKIASTIGFIAGTTYQYVRGVYTEPRTWGATVTFNF